MALTVEETIAAASQPSKNDRRRLIEALKAAEPNPRHSIAELRGLGKEIWQGQDAQGYVNQERDSWAS